MPLAGLTGYACICIFCKRSGQTPNLSVWGPGDLHPHDGIEGRLGFRIQKNSKDRGEKPTFSEKRIYMNIINTIMRLIFSRRSASDSYYIPAACCWAASRVF